jgi:hypothetical protein
MAMVINMELALSLWVGGYYWADPTMLSPTVSTSRPTPPTVPQPAVTRAKMADANARKAMLLKDILDAVCVVFTPPKISGTKAARHGVKPYPAFLKSIRSLIRPSGTDSPQAKPPTAAPMDHPYGRQANLTLSLPANRSAQIETSTYLQLWSPKNNPGNQGLAKPGGNINFTAPSFGSTQICRV